MYRNSAVWSLLVVLGLAAPGFAQSAKRPNVLVILADDMRWDCMSCAGHKHLKTPHLDRLARQGVHFKNAFCTTSLCSPSRASVLSGLYAFKHGVRDNFTEFPSNLPNLARQLQLAGYVTGYIGKWHMGEDNDEPRPGFNHWASHKGQGKYFDTDFNINGRRQTRKGYYTHVATDLAIDFLKEKRDRPFLLMLGHKAPHSFYVPEPKYERLFDQVDIEYPPSAFMLDGKPAWIKTRRTTWHGIHGPLFEFRKKFPDERPEAVKDFAAMIRAYWATIQSIDDSAGRLLQTLEELGILDDTIVVFIGDNGLLNGEHGMVDKRTMHEPSIRVPMVMRYPRLVPSDEPRVVDKMVLHVDLASSLLDLCGAPPLPGAHGKSWKKLAQGDAAGWRTAWFYEYNYEKQFPYTPNVRGLRTEDWAYMHYPHGDGKPDRHPAELYDLKNDPDQLRNLALGEPSRKLLQMRLELAAAMRELGLTDDRMPMDEGIKQTLPNLKIR